jgi:hypothetical protein
MAGRNNPAESGRRSKTDVIGDDQQDVWRTLGGAMRGAHHDFDCAKFSLITPPNFGSGGGSCLPLIVVVASGEPGVPVVCWANDDAVVRANAAHNAPPHCMRNLRFIFITR